MNTRNFGGRKQLLCLHGIRFLSMAWIILVHAYTYSFGLVKSDDLTRSLKLMDNWEFQAVVQASFAVDTFFLLSGFLSAHIFFKEITEKNGKIPWWYFYFHRYWRLTPTLAMVLGVKVTLLDFNSNKFFLQKEETCKWWWALLYLNNVIDEPKTCMSWIWYLANDMQFYVISPVFLYPLWRWPKVGLSITGLAMTSSWIISALITYFKELIPGYALLTETKDFVEYDERTAKYFIDLYIKPYGRIGPYLIGLLLAYLLHSQEDNKRNFSIWEQFLGWTVATANALMNVYGIHGTNPGVLAVCLYNAFSRTCFTASVAWVIYACLEGYGGIINAFLSHRFFIPLSKLSYCAYLVHPIYYTMYYNSLMTDIYLNHMTMVTMFFSCLVAGYVAAFVTSLMFEAPMMAIEKLFIKKT